MSALSMPVSPRLFPVLCGVLAVSVSMVIHRPAYAQEGISCAAEPTDMTVSYGDAVRCSIGVSGDSDVFRFAGAAGETIVIQASTASSVWPCVELIGPDNVRTRACSIAAFNRIDTTLAVGGTHTILVSSYFATSFGNYTVALERIAPPSNTARTLQYGQTISEDLPFAGDLDLFAFRGTAGDVITVSASNRSGGVWPCVELVRPAGARSVTCAIRATNQVEATLVETGVHAVLIHAYFATSFGGYTVGVQCLVGPCVTGPPPPPPPPPPPTGVPGPPLNLRGAATGSTAILNWTAPVSGGAPTSYVFEAGTAPGAMDIIVFDTGSISTSVTATAVPQGAYYVRVKARNSTGVGIASNEVLLLVGGAPGPCVGPPSSPTGLSVSVSARLVTLDWVAPAGPLTTFVIDVGSVPGATDIVTFATGNTRTTLSAIAAPGTYFIRIRARNACGTGSPSLERTAVVF